jgi:hypothetical protein
VRTINCEYLKILSVHVANPAGNIGGVTIPGIHYRVSICRKPCFSGRKLIEVAERNPGFVAVLSAASDWREHVTHDRHCKDQGGNAVKENSQLHEELAPAEARW